MTKKQMKNHYPGKLRWDPIINELWKAWKTLKEKSGMGFDPVLRTISAPEEAWASYIQVN